MVVDFSFLPSFLFCIFLGIIQAQESRENVPSSAISTPQHLALTSLPRPGVWPFQLQVRVRDEEIVFHVSNAPLTLLPRLSIGFYQGQEGLCLLKQCCFQHFKIPQGKETVSLSH